MKRRQLVLLLGGGSAAAASAGTGAFSSVSADREVSVNVVEDDEAYLGLEQTSHEISGSHTDVVKITNQFTSPLQLTVTIKRTEGPIDEIDIRDVGKNDCETSRSDGFSNPERSEDGDEIRFRLCTGDKAFVTARCTGDDGDSQFELSFDGEAGATTVEKKKSFDVECTVTDKNDEDDSIGEADVSDQIKQITFFGGGKKVRILTTENQGGGNGVAGTVQAKFYYEDDSEDEEFSEVSVNEKLEFDKSVTKVEIESIGVFANPDSGNSVTVS